METIKKLRKAFNKVVITVIIGQAMAATLVILGIEGSKFNDTTELIISIVCGVVLVICLILANKYINEYSKINVK